MCIGFLSSLYKMNERRPGQGRDRSGDRVDQRLIIALSRLRCVSVCCTRNGRHVLAVTCAQTHAHLHFKETIDLTGPVRHSKIYAIKIYLERFLNDVMCVRIIQRYVLSRPVKIKPSDFFFPFVKRAHIQRCRCVCLTTDVSALIMFYDAPRWQ